MLANARWREAVAFVEVSNVAFDSFWAQIINFLKQFINLSLDFVCCVVGFVTVSGCDTWLGSLE